MVLVSGFGMVRCTFVEVFVLVYRLVVCLDGWFGVLLWVCLFCVLRV